jgi:hypothetical protein
MDGFFAFGDEYIGGNTSLQMNQISCFAQQYSVNLYEEVVTFNLYFCKVDCQGFLDYCLGDPRAPLGRKFAER